MNAIDPAKAVHLTASHLPCPLCEEVHEEIGDLLFSAVNLARHYKVDAERALADATTKFTKRFNQIESSLTKDMQDMTLEELEAEWQKAKASQAAT